MWILKNSKDLLDYIQYWSLSSCNSINTFDFSTLYTTIPHSMSKDTWSEVDCRFKSHRVQTKDYDVGIYFLSIKNEALRIRSKDYKADNQYNVSELSDRSTRWLLFQHYKGTTKCVRLVQSGHHLHLIKCSLFSPWYSWGKTVHLVGINNQ
jgi:hypothetical protein